MRALKVTVSRKGKDYVVPIPSTELGLLLLGVLCYGVYSGAVTVDAQAVLDSLSALVTSLQEISS